MTGGKGEGEGRFRYQAKKETNGVCTSIAANGSPQWLQEEERIINASITQYYTLQ